MITSITITTEVPGFRIITMNHIVSIDQYSIQEEEDTDDENISENIS